MFTPPPPRVLSLNFTENIVFWSHFLCRSWQCQCPGKNWDLLVQRGIRISCGLISQGNSAGGGVFGLSVAGREKVMNTVVQSKVKIAQRHYMIRVYGGSWKKKLICHASSADCSTTVESILVELSALTATFHVKHTHIMTLRGLYWVCQLAMNQRSNDKWKRPIKRNFLVWWGRARNFRPALTFFSRRLPPLANEIYSNLEKKLDDFLINWQMK